MDQYYSCLSYEDEYRTTTDTLEVAQGWIDWAIKHNNIDARIEQPISIMELTVSSKKLLRIDINKEG